MGKGGSGYEKGWMLQCRKTHRRMAALRGRSLRGRGLGYRRCRPGFTAGRRPILAAGSVTCSTSLRHESALSYPR